MNKKQILWIIVPAILLLIAAATAVVFLLANEMQALPEQIPQSQQTGSTEELSATDSPSSDQENEPLPAPHIVVLDPGHQNHITGETEPNGPGSSEKKATMTMGTQGSRSGLAEYELNLQIATALEEELTARGYQVYMTRRDNDVSISNVERAKYAMEVQGEILVHIHANGSEDPSVSGAMTICQTPENPFQNLYAPSRRLSDCILNAYCDATGIPLQYVWETDTMTGINWCEIPSTFLEMGYMTNPSEDMNMADPTFQKTMVMGIANGIDDYFAQPSK